MEPSQNQEYAYTPFGNPDFTRNIKRKQHHDLPFHQLQMGRSEFCEIPCSNDLLKLLIFRINSLEATLTTKIDSIETKLTEFEKKYIIHPKFNNVPSYIS